MIYIDKCFFFLLISFCLVQFIHSQETPKPNFGIQLVDQEVKMPNKYSYIKNIILQVLPKRKSRRYYNENNEAAYDTDFKDVIKSVVSWSKKAGEDKTYLTTIPPLKPNRFYRLNVSYYSSESIVALFLLMHEEKNNDWYTSKKEWMKLLGRISDRNSPFTITYDPTILELQSFKNRIDNIDLSILDVKESEYIKDIKDEKAVEKKKKELEAKKTKLINKLHSISKNEFEVLNFAENQGKYIDQELVDFCKWVKSASTFSEDDTTKFSEILVNSFDYVNIYRFYENYILGALNDNSIKQGKLKEFIDKAIETEKATYGTGDVFIPNYLSNFEEIVLNKTKPISTYSTSFETAYKLSLVPDFGYVGYVTDSENTPKGGNLFLGVNISLSPSNKDVPMQISKLSFRQRFSIHTGVTIGSIAEDNVRDNFFGNYSLLLGGGYKVLTQGTRINFGGLLYNKIDAINGSKSLAIQPYIGLSIDLEIKKWLQTVFPNIKI